MKINLTKLLVKLLPHKQDYTTTDAPCFDDNNSTSTETAYAFELKGEEE